MRKQESGTGSEQESYFTIFEKEVTLLSLGESYTRLNNEGGGEACRSAGCCRTSIRSSIPSGNAAYTP